MTAPPSDGPDLEKTEWRHSRSSVVARLGDPRHSANDLILNAGKDAKLEGKFAYAKVSKDLEDEHVTLFVRLENNWEPIGKSLTDDDGRVRFELPAAKLSGGMNAYQMIAHGDLSRAYGAVWVFPPQTKFAVFDIDGTLTSGGFVRKHIYGREILPRAGAADLTKSWREKRQVQPLYLTARPYHYHRYSRAWLRQHGFEPGPVVHSDSFSQGLPSHRSAGKFKQQWLKTFVDTTGVDIVAAYGDQDTDVCAFARAGIAPRITWIWGEEARACPDHELANATTDYAAHIAEMFE